MFFRLRMQKKKKKRPPEKLFRKLPLHLFGQGNWIKWHPLVMRVLWKWAQCDPSRNWEEGRNDVCMSPQGHHHGKSPFFQNKKKNTGYCNEAKLQWDKLKKPPKLCFRQLMNYRKLPLESFSVPLCMSTHTFYEPIPTFRIIQSYGLYNHMDFS